jgi:hypothetical protein
MNRLPSRPSRSVRRNAEIWTVKLAGLTKMLGQTRPTNSCWLTSSPGRSSNTTRISRARPPRRPGLAPSSRRNCAGSKRTDPNAIFCSVLGRHGWSFSRIMVGPYPKCEGRVSRHPPVRGLKPRQGARSKSESPEAVASADGVMVASRMGELSPDEDPNPREAQFGAVRWSGIMPYVSGLIAAWRSRITSAQRMRVALNAALR